MKPLSFMELLWIPHNLVNASALIWYGHHCLTLLYGDTTDVVAADQERKFELPDWGPSVQK